MFRPGGRVIHPEYGVGLFKKIIGQRVRIAVVEFPVRGRRHFTLPSESLRSMESLRREGWGRFFGRYKEGKERREGRCPI